MTSALIKLVAAVCLAEICTMVGVFTFPALLPGFMDAWALTNTQAGWISGVYFAAYALTAPVLVSLTDRVDARRVYMVGALANVVACAGFALLADGFWPALVFRALGGAALAGTYMPGLRVLVDRVSAAAARGWCLSTPPVSAWVPPDPTQSRLPWRKRPDGGRPLVWLLARRRWRWCWCSC